MQGGEAIAAAVTERCLVGSEFWLGGRGEAGGRGGAEGRDGGRGVEGVEGGGSLSSVGDKTNGGHCEPNLPNLGDANSIHLEKPCQELDQPREVLGKKTSEYNSLRSPTSTTMFEICQD